MSGSSVPGLILLSCFTLAGFNGMPVEAQVLRDRDIFESVISMMLKTRKSSSHKVYHHTWKSHFSWCEAGSFHPRKKKALWDESWLSCKYGWHLTLCIIKGQILVLAILFQGWLVSHSFKSDFCTRVSFIYLTYATLWYLSLFLLVGPLKMPFQPIRNIPAYTLTWKVTFLVTVASASLPILVLHTEQAMLRTQYFLSKVVLVFYL